MQKIILLLIPFSVAPTYFSLIKKKYPKIKPIVCNFHPNNDSIPDKQHLFLPLGKELETVRSFCQKHNYKVVAIVNQLSSYEVLHSQLVDLYKVHGPSATATQAISRKDLLHQLMEKHGLAFYRPQTVVTKLESVAKVLKSVQFPVVVKPYAGSHSRGVYTLFKQSDYDAVKSQLEQHFAKEKSILADENHQNIVLVEQYIYGKQVTPLPYVDEKGKVHIITLVDIVRASDLKQNHMQLLYRTVPSKYPDKVRQKMHYVLQKLATVTSLRSTLLDPEFLVVGKHVYLIEINVRMGGFRAGLVKPAFNLDLHLVSLQIAFGEPVSDHIDADKTATACEIWEEKSGIVEKITLPKSKQIVQSKISVEPGEMYCSPPEGNKPLGSFYVVDDTNSLATAKRIRAKTKIVFKNEV